MSNQPIKSDYIPIPYVTEQNSRGERSYDIYSRSVSYTHLVEAGGFSEKELDAIFQEKNLD